MVRGHGELPLPIGSDNPEVRNALTILDAAEKHPERDLVTITLSGQRFSIDSVLQQELSVTLLYYEMKWIMKSGH